MKTRRILSLLVAMVMVLSLVPSFAFPASAEGEEIAVFYTDSGKWGNINVYYTPAGQSWPGKQMTWLYTNGYGENVYGAKVPANVNMVIFNGNANQTQDIFSNIADGAWWYANGYISNVYHAPVAPTCTENGNVAYYELDGHQYGVNLNVLGSTVDPATGHSWDYDHPVWGTPTESGFAYEVTVTFTCTECDATTQQTANMTGMLVEKDASCSEGGYKEATFELTFDGHNYSKKITWDVTPPSGEHDFTSHIAAKNATCTEAGNTEYWQCVECGKYFADAACTHEIEENSWVIQATGHHFVNGVCTVCNAEDPDYVAPPTATVRVNQNPKQDAPIKTNPVDGDVIATAALGCEYTFTAVQPTQEQLDYYGGWDCDYEVSFSEPIAANTLGLYGKYEGFGSVFEAAFYFDSAIPANTPIRLLHSADLNTTYADIVSFGSFTCGAFNASADNIGTTMTVKLVMTNGTDTITITSTEYVFAAPPKPTAEITEVDNPRKDVTLYNPNNYSATVMTADLNAEYLFEAGEPADNVQKYYGDWNCDFEVSFSKAIPANTFGLWGKYADYDVGFVVPMDVPANEPIKMLDLAGKTLSYRDVYRDVQDFGCGVFNLSELNKGTEMTVKLLIWNENEEIAIAEETYTFDGVKWVKPLPNATFTQIEAPKNVDVHTDLTHTLGKVDPQIAYNFIPDDNSGVGSAAYETYEGWFCDFVVSFDKAVPAQSLGLYGAYGDWGNIAFLNPEDLEAYDEIYLLSTLGLDQHLSYHEVVTLVKSFNCGAFNLSDGNAGTKMTVKLNMFQLDDAGNKINVVTLANTDYTFGEKTYWVVDNTYYYYVAEGEEGKVVNEAGTALVDNTENGPHFESAGTKYQVSVKSQDTNGHSGVVLVSGGGLFEEGVEVTVKANLTSGYSFVGWFENRYDGDPVSTSLTYSFFPDADVEMIAVFAPVATTNLTVTGNKYTVTAGGVTTEQRGTKNLSYPVGTLVTLSYVDEDTTFMYWVNASDNIVSTNKTYTFPLVGETELFAYCSAGHEAGEDADATIAVLNAYNQVIAQRRVGDEVAFDNLMSVAYPTKMGYTFDKWVIQEVDLEATYENVKELFSAETDVILHIIPTYTAKGESYEVVVKIYDASTDTLSEAIQTLRANTGTKITVSKAQVAAWAGDITANDIDFWSLDGGANAAGYGDLYTIISAEKGASFVLTAVINGNEEEKPTLTITEMVRSMNGAKYRISTTEKYFVPDGYTVAEVGFVYSTTDISENDFVIGAQGVTKRISGLTANSAIYTFNANTSDGTKTLYIRGYLIYRDKTNGNLTTIYTNLHSMKFGDN